ncbi:ABC transporter permease [Muricomes sp. OA1]|uniref:Autoinducer 2 import system permease protein LsrD n=1 Tax=Hungatella hathewayi TaxID=154046 RepID=A0A3E2WXH3_9FIRM|nr:MULTISPECIES: ABC transporter permease [Clostridia]MEE0200510.1 ABC transporter permease [Muricomes sp.]MCH1975181.1 ABC transporter permease [Muricomes sp. OA1]MRM89902.1 ABC transporter permease [Faecalicatena contorta]RGC32091.1 ABC transporter permease [Hungatella hathewayi]GKH34013.1 branched-chain amino acid ABC transporter permease [Faecalicatena contorta]
MAGKSGRTIANVPEKSWKKTVLSWEGMLVVLFIVINIFCSSISQSYQVSNVLREMPKYLTEVFLMLPMAYILILGEIDISVGATVCLSATMTCMVCNKDMPFILVVLTALVVGTVCGLVNGLILTKFTELPPMIVTLGTQIVFRGIAEIALGSGGSISLSNADGFRMIAGKVGMIPYILFVVVIFAVIFTVVLSKTTFGRSVYAIGSNRLAAYYSGIHVQKIRLIIYMVMGFMAGLAALFLTSVLYGANTTTGNGFELDAIAMAVFGGISTAGGKGKLQGGIISAFIIICLRIGLGQINMNPQLILIILGALLILAVLLPNIGGELKLKKKTAAVK